MGYFAGFTAAVAIIIAPLVWGWLKRRPGLLEDGSVRLLIIVAWLHVVTPSVLQLLINGRLVSTTQGAPAPGIAILVSRATEMLFLLVAVSLIVTSVGRRPTRHIGWLFAAVTPWVTLQASHLLAGGRPTFHAAVYPVAAVAIWLRSPRIQVLATIGALTGVAAAASLLLIAVRPDVALYSSPGDGAKAVYSSGLLAGIYPHANMLGMAMALGIPFVLLIRRRSVRLSCLALSVVALLGTASRSSLVAAAAGLLLYLIVRRNQDRAGQWAAVPLLGAVAVMAYLPLSAKEPHAYTDRGRIWMDALAHWQERPWMGYGPSYWIEQGKIANDIGGLYTHSHNLMVNTLVTGGVVMAAAMLVMLFATWTRAVDLSADGYVHPLIYLMIAVAVSWLEASLSINQLAGWSLWLPLLLILLSREPSDDEAGEAGQPGVDLATRTSSGGPRATASSRP